MDLFACRDRPAWSPTGLALVAVLQFVEGLTDRQAAEAVRARIDFKYALGLPLDDPGFDFSVLSEFRERPAGSGGGRRLLDGALGAAREKGLLKSASRARADSSHVLSSARRPVSAGTFGGDDADSTQRAGSGRPGLADPRRGDGLVPSLRRPG